MQGTGLVSKHLNQGLNAACAMKIHRYFDQGRDDRLHELLERGHVAYLDQLLAKVVAKLVHHDIWEYLEHNMNETGSEDGSMLDLVFLEFPLDNAAACLIIGHDLNLLEYLKLLSGELLLQVLW